MLFLWFGRLVSGDDAAMLEHNKNKEIDDCVESLVAVLNIEAWFIMMPNWTLTSLERIDDAPLKQTISCCKGVQITVSSLARDCDAQAV